MIWQKIQSAHSEDWVDLSFSNHAITPKPTV